MSDRPSKLFRADLIAIVAAGVLAVAFVVGVSGLPGPALAHLVDWMVEHGYLNQPGQLAGLILA